jgi:SagB-type dehydrogenase family enzyme
MITTCFDYHRETSYERNRMNGHFMDWANQPDVFKTYEGREPILLPREVELPKEKFAKLLAGETPGVPVSGMDLATLSRLLLLTYTFTAKSRSQEGNFYFRSTASAGALYPTELYTALRDVENLESGIYHYAIHHHGLVPLRTGDFGASVMTFFLTAIFFRSAWKYRARAYRYHLLDTGHVEENLLLALRALGLSCQVSYDFDDDRVNDLLGLDEKREVTLALVSLVGQGVAPEKNKEEIPQVPEPVAKASRVSAKEVDYPAIREIHDAGKEKIAGSVGQVEMSDALGVRSKEWRNIEAPLARSETADYPDCVFKRRSKRNFVKRTIQKDAMSGLLKGVSSMGWNPYEGSVSVGFLTGQVEGMEPGFYLLDRKKKATGMIASGSHMDRMTRACLDQAWLANAGIHFLFLANLDLLERAWGPRGYRYAMMTAGRLGQRLYIAATAMGLGCCGIGALYDGEARELLGLNESSRLLYLVAVGVVKRP